MGPHDRHPLLVLVTVTLLVGTFFAPAAAVTPLSSGAENTDAESAVSVVYDVELPEGDDRRIALTIEVEGAAGEELAFRLRGSDIDVQESHGFDVDGSRFVTTGARESAEVTVEYDPSEQLVSPVRDDFRATSEWALFRIFLSAPDHLAVNEIVEPDGIRGSSFVFVGAYETYERSVADDDITLVIPDAAAVTDPPAEIADTLAETSGYLRIGARQERTLAFVGPEELRSGGIVGDGGEFWAHQDVDLSWNTWTHEYVHLRQDRHHFTDAQWLVEGEARYYQHLVAYKRGDIEYEGLTGFDAFRLQFRSYGGHHDVQLDDPATWRFNSEYQKGARVLAALDAEIRQRTDGERDYRHVMHRLNQRDHVTAATLKAETEAVVGEPMDEFFESYVSGTAMPSAPDDPDLYRDWPIEPDVAYSITDRVETEAPPEADVPGHPVHVEETVNVTYAIDTEGSDPLLAPAFEIDPPDGWEYRGVEVHGGEWELDGDRRGTSWDVFADEPIEITVSLEAPAQPIETGVLSVTFTDADGAHLVSDTEMTAVRPVEANITVDEPIHEPGTTVTLDATDSEVPRELVGYEWDLTGDGTFETVTDRPKITETFEPGAREVSVRVTNDIGVWDTNTVWVNTTDTPEISVNDSVTTVAGEWFTIPVNVSNEHGAVEVVWTIPDGNTTTGQPGAFVAGPGLHELEVAAVDEYGGTNGTVIEILSVDSPTIVPEFPDAIPADRSVTLETSIDKEVGGYEVIWELPGNDTRAGESVDVEFPPGEHNITIRATGSYGLESNTTHTIVASDVPRVSLDGPAIAEANETVSFGVDIDNDIGNTTTTWAVDGEVVHDGSAMTWDGTFPPGTHEISVTVTDEYGIAETVTQELHVPEQRGGEAEQRDDAIPGLGLAHAVVAIAGFAVILLRRS